MPPPRMPGAASRHCMSKDLRAGDFPSPRTAHSCILRSPPALRGCPSHVHCPPGPPVEPDHDSYPPALATIWSQHQPLHTPSSCPGRLALAEGYHFSLSLFLKLEPWNGSLVFGWLFLKVSQTCTVDLHLAFSLFTLRLPWLPRSRRPR